MTRRIPLPGPARRSYRVLRISGVVLAVAGLVLGYALWNLDDRSGAFVIGSLGVGFALLTLVSPWSRLWMPAFAIVGMLLAVSMQNWLVAVAVVASAGWLWWRIRRPRTPGFDPQAITLTDPSAVMKGADRFVAAFTGLGYRQVGALAVPIQGFPVIASLLISADRSAYAEVTDSAISITSVFPGRRTLTTRNSGVSSVPSTILTNDVGGGSPAALVDGHRRAIDLLDASGDEPELLDPATLSSLVLDLERESLAWANQNPRRPRSVRGSGPLWKSQDVEARIERWRGSAHRAGD